MTDLRYGIALAILVATDGGVHAQASAGIKSSYYPANIRLSAYPSRDFKVEIFPPDRKETPIQVPFRLNVFAWSPGGAALFNTTQNSPTQACIYRIDLKPVRAGRSICPRGLEVIFDFAVSAQEDKFFVSAQVIGDRGLRSCGIFEIRLPEETVRQVLVTPYCEALSAWHSLSLSPDGDRAVGIAGNQLDVIDVARGTTHTVADEVLSASWSPDGRWIAALKRRGGILLINANDLKQRRTLAEARVQWSPDSRYLLQVKECRFPVAVNPVGTFRALDVATGKTVAFKSSTCSVEGAVGWVSATVLKEEN
jgi:hypothetical protein